VVVNMPSQRLQTANAIREHVIEDLQPYVCTYELCTTPHILYSKRRDWIEHEDSHISTGWQCLIHADMIYASLAEYQMHLSEMHPADKSSLEHPELLQASLVRQQGIERSCPFCGVNDLHSSQMARHIGNHLIDLALFALPREITEEAEVDSCQTTHTESSSRATIDSGDLVFEDPLLRQDVEEQYSINGEPSVREDNNSKISQSF